MFLNCNYPNEYKQPKGKPKELKKVTLEMKMGKTTLYETPDDIIWLSNGGFYFGIDLGKFIVKSMIGVNISETVGAINTALLEWKCDEQMLLGREEEGLLKKYLLTRR